MLQSCLFASAVLLSTILGTSYAANSTNTGRVLYFIDNLPDNGVVAVRIGPDGLLSDGAVVPTGGNGAPFVFAGTNTPAIPAALDSTGSVRVYKDVGMAAEILESMASDSYAI